MEQQNLYKILAAIMILTMIIVPVAYVVTSPRTDYTEQVNEQAAQQEKYNPEFWSVNQPFFSISDALNMTPVGVVSASYADLESMTPQMLQWARNDLPVNDVDALYKSNTTKIYLADIDEGNNKSFLLLSTMTPERNDFEYMVLPNTYYGHYILKRQDTGAINVMGTPVIYSPPDVAGEVLGIITSLNKTETSYDKYAGLLEKVPPASFQMVNSSIGFASQHYIGVRETNGNYELTAAYLNASASTMQKLDQQKKNSTVRGFTQYNITQMDNYTIVSITGPDFFTVLTEGIS